jgi:hypothetical protein
LSFLRKQETTDQRARPTKLNTLRDRYLLPQEWHGEGSLGNPELCLQFVQFGQCLGKSLQRNPQRKAVAGPVIKIENRFAALHEFR